LGQEFVIKSQDLEDKINQLLPSQGGFQPGVDLSASTTIIPIVDLTESAQGSNLRQDLQTAFGINSSVFSVTNATTTIINTTGYFKIQGYYKSQGASPDVYIQITDGTTTKRLVEIGTTVTGTLEYIEIVVFVQAGESIVVVSGANAKATLATRQIADLQGNLVNP